MESKLIELAARAKGLISERLQQNDIDGVSRVSEAAVRIKRLQDQLGKVQQDIDAVEATLKDFAPLPHPPHELGHSSADEDFADFDAPGTRNRKKRLRIELHWDRASKPLGSEVLERNTASSTIAKFLGRLSAVLGPIQLDKLARMKINRGMLVSKNPRKDFINRSTGDTYGHQEIPGTGYWVLTHSSTAEKVADVQSICTFLNLPNGLVKVSEIAYCLSE